MIENQIPNLTHGPSFAHNLGFKCSNGSCEAILDIYTLRSFQCYLEHSNARCFDPYNQALSFRESRRTPSPQLWVCEFHPHTWPKWGCDKESSKRSTTARRRSAARSAPTCTCKTSSKRRSTTSSRSSTASHTSTTRKLR